MDTVVEAGTEVKVRLAKRFRIKQGMMHGLIREGDLLYFDEKGRPRRGDWVWLVKEDGTGPIVQFAHQYRGIRYVNEWTSKEYRRRPISDGERVGGVAYKLERELVGGAR